MKEAIVKEEKDSGELLQIRVKSSAEKEEEEKEYQEWYEKEKKINKVHYFILFFMNIYRNEQKQSFIKLLYENFEFCQNQCFFRTVILKKTSRQLLLYLLGNIISYCLRHCHFILLKVQVFTPF